MKRNLRNLFLRPLPGVAAFAIFAAPFTATAQSPLVAHYNFDNPATFTSTAGDTVPDVSGGGKNGIEGANITWDSGGISGGAMTTSASGNPHFATSFAPGTIAGNSFAVNFWVKTGATTSTDNYKDWGRLDFSNGTTTQYAQLRSLPVAAPDNGGFYFRDPTPAYYKTNTSANLKDNQWHMVTVVADGSNFTLFTDGGNAVTFNDYARTSAFSLTGLRIGNANSSSVSAIGTVGLAGLLDDVQLYSAPLTASEVARMHANPGLAASDMRSWNPAAATNDWTSAANWSETAVAIGAAGEGGNPASTNRHVAFIGAHSVAAGDGIGIDMGATSGSYALGAIALDSASGNLRVGNSSTSNNGTLRLNGALLGNVPNMIVRVAGDSDLTIADTPDGSGSQTMAVELGGSENVMQVASGRSVTFASDVAEAAAGTGLTLVGGGSASFTGALSVSGSLAVAGALNLGSNSLSVPSVTLSSGSITGSGTLTAGNSIGFLANNASGTTTLATNLAGTTSLRKEGAGTLVLTGANSYDGGTIVAGGVLSVSDIADTGSSHIGILGTNNSRISIVGGTLRYTGSGAQQTNRRLWMDQTSAAIEVTEATGTLTLTPEAGTRSAAFTKSGAGTLVLNGAFSGAARIDVNGGTLELGAANTHTGATRVAGGAELRLAHGQALQNSALTVETGGTLAVSGTGGTYQVHSLAGAGNVNAVGNTLAVTGGQSTRLSGTLNAGTLAQQGSGTLALDGTATLGAVEISNGVLSVGNTAALGNAAINLTGGTLRHAAHDGALSNNITLSGDAATTRIDVGVDADYLVVGGGGGGGARDSSGGGGGGGVISNLSGNGPALSLGAGTTAVIVGDGGAGGVGPDAGGTTRGQQGQSSALGGIVALGGGGGGGYAAAGGAGASGGGGGRNSAGGAGTAGQGFAGGAGAGGTTTGHPGGGGGGAGEAGQQGVLNVKGGDGGDGLAASLLSAGLATALNVGEVSGSAVYFGGGGGGTGHRSASTVASGAGGLGGGGDGASPFVAPSVVAANTGGGGGAARSDNANAAISSGAKGGSGVVIVRYAGNAVGTGGNDIRTVDGYTYHTFTATGSQDLNLTPTRTISGVISGSGGFTFDSPGGTLVLDATNTYSGDTIVAGGTLALGSSGSISNSNVVLNGGAFNVSAVSGGYTIESGTSLSGSGTVTGDLTIDGALTIGSSPGTMSFAGDLNLNGTAGFEITDPTLTLGSYDLALGTGTVTFGGVLNLFFSGGTYADGTTVQLFDFDGGYSGDFASINFTGLDPGQSATFDAATGFVTVIPEPAAALLGGLGLLTLLRRRR